MSFTSNPPSQYYTQAGTCNRCQAPVWVPSSWNGTTPAPITFSCVCNQLEEMLKLKPERKGFEETIQKLDREFNKNLARKVDELAATQGRIEKILTNILDELKNRVAWEEDCIGKKILKD